MRDPVSKIKWKLKRTPDVDLCPPHTHVHAPREPTQGKEIYFDVDAQLLKNTDENRVYESISCIHNFSCAFLKLKMTHPKESVLASEERHL